MNNNNLYQVLEKYAADSAVILDNTDDSDVRFSWRYKRKRKAIITAYRKTSEQPLGFDKKYRKVRFGQKIRFAVFVAVTALLMTGAAAYITHYVGGLMAKQYDDHSDGFALDWENAPRTLEKTYRINYDLSDFDMEIVCDDEYQYWEYYSKQEPSYQYINFSYGVKEGFQNARLNTEDSKVENIQLNGYEILYYEQPNGSKSFIWDNGEYILEFHTNSDYDFAVKIISTIKEVEFC
ncbi:MAG: DUF4367 domain-containing protein [Ruminococcus sp.]|nr:DUF4367 domain-containing protein [Ruminococcus sp.]